MVTRLISIALVIAATHSSDARVTGGLSGRVTYAGGASAAEPIDMSAEQFCVDAHRSAPAARQRVRVGAQNVLIEVPPGRDENYLLARIRLTDPTQLLAVVAATPLLSPVSVLATVSSPPPAAATPCPLCAGTHWRRIARLLPQRGLPP